MSAKSITVLTKFDINGQPGAIERRITAEPVGRDLTIHREIKDGTPSGEDWAVTFTVSGFSILTDLPSRKAARAAAKRLAPIVAALRDEVAAIAAETRAAKGW
jgi:hypothetical protein